MWPACRQFPLRCMLNTAYRVASYRKKFSKCHAVGVSPVEESESQHRFLLARFIVPHFVISVQSQWLRPTAAAAAQTCFPRIAKILTDRYPRGPHPRRDSINADYIPRNWSRWTAINGLLAMRKTILSVGTLPKHASPTCDTSVVSVESVVSNYRKWTACLATNLTT